MDNELSGFFTRKKDSAFTFNYVYSCDIEDVLFRVKICNLDGILPPSHNSFNKPTTVQNHYEYNIVEDAASFNFIDNLISSDDENEENGEENCEDETKNEDESVTHSFLYPSSSNSINSPNLNQSSKKKNKNRKLAEIIFGSLNQPFRALSNHAHLTCDLVSNGQQLCPPQQIQCKQKNNRYEWNEWMLFSLTLGSLPRDTMVCFTIWDTIVPGKSKAVARTSISLFSKRGCLRKGLYDLRLFFNEDWEEYFNDNRSTFNNKSTEKNKSGVFSSDLVFNDIISTNRRHRSEECVLPESELNPKLKKLLNLSQGKDQRKILKDFDADALESSSTTRFSQQNLNYYPIGTLNKPKKIKQLNKFKKRYQNNQMRKLDWLDRLTFLQIEAAMVRDKEMSTHVFLTVEFPTIMLEGIEYTTIHIEDNKDECCQYDIIDKDVSVISDPEINMVNLVESKHHALARSVRSGISQSDLKPNAQTRNQLNAIVNYPSTHLLSHEEQDLIWRFRFYLRNQKKALAKFLKTVNWNCSSEAEQAIDLMNEWAPMDIEDSLELLSPFFTHPAVRKYAVSRLKEAVDEDLLLYLLQLVQALKYENFPEIRQSFNQELAHYQQQQPIHKEKKNISENTIMAEAVFPESSRIFASTINPETVDHSMVKSTHEKDATTITNNTGDDLATFLLNRACDNDELANYFFWYLCVECESAKSLGSTGIQPELKQQVEPVNGNNNSSTNTYPSVVMSSVVSSSYLVPPPPPFQVGKEAESNDSKTAHKNRSNISELSSSSYSANNVIDMYLIMLKRFNIRLLDGTPEMAARYNFLQRQQDFVVKLQEIMKEVSRETGNRLKKIDRLQSILESPDHKFRFNFSKNDPLPLPLNPNIKVIGVAAREAILYKSTTMPAKIGFITTEGNIFYTIFKNGDDLRQDDLALQMISLMDKLLRKENLDLKLTPYRVLACSSKHGFVQFIDSHSIDEVISSEGSIQNYLKKISQNKHNRPSVSPQSGISPEIMDAYIKSCAGYCVITYLLGVGDRHLDNLLLTKTGRLFHIDFGFILGRDPKVRPPPMKITREMVDAMGGMDSENFSKFCSLVRTAFQHLRRHANLILNLFSLMVDASVPDIALEPDKTVQKVQDKFKLELDDEQADHYINEQVEQSVRSIMPVVVDQLHKMTQYLRN